jgi:hypothetical protein
MSESADTDSKAADATFMIDPPGMSPDYGFSLSGTYVFQQGRQGVTLKSSRDRVNLDISAP